MRHGSDGDRSSYESLRKAPMRLARRGFFMRIRHTSMCRLQRLPVRIRFGQQAIHARQHEQREQRAH